MDSPRLIPHVVSDRAKQRPQQIWAAIPKNPVDASAGYEEVTFARLNYAVTRAAQWMQETLDDRPPSKVPRAEPLAYIGPPDTRYIIFTIAAIKAGFTMLYLSPRNSDEAQRAVIEEADCKLFLYTTSMKTRMDKLFASHQRLLDMTHIIVPEQEDLLEDKAVPDFPYERTVEQARREPLVILHTSSTTGLPKTVPLNQGYGIHDDVLRHLPNHNGLDIITRKPFYGPCRMFVAMPLYHAGGVLLSLLKSLYQDIIAVFQPANLPLTAQLYNDILRYGKCTGCVIPPYLLEEMLAEPSHFDTLASLDFVQFGSGPLSKSAGDKLLTRQKNCPHFIGSSETNIYALLELDDPVADWQYFRFHPSSGADFRPIDDTKQVCELFIVRSSASEVVGAQPIFELFPNLEEWSTKDLYVRHPEKADHWRYMGRNDDVLVLSNGEKLNPVDTEARINGSHPSVTGALVIGQGRFAAGLLLEVQGIDTSNPSEVSQLLAEIWPTIDATNRDAPAHGHLSKDFILFTSADKPFSRTPKLSVRRKASIALYEEEINQMYEGYSKGVDNEADSSVRSIDVTSAAGIESFVLETLRSDAGMDLNGKVDDDFFALGMDSLQVMRLTRRIKTALAQKGVTKGMDARLLYNNPTVKCIAQAIMSHVNPTGHETTSNSDDAISKMIQEYGHFDNLSPQTKDTIDPVTRSVDNQSNVILTGSTGSLGCYILLTLLASPKVGQVYCINRAEDAKARQRSSMAQHDPSPSQRQRFEKNVHFLRSTSLGAQYLGLSAREEYQSLKQSNITHIIHNAWPVNFNHALSSFEPHIAGVKRLVEFCAAVPGQPKIIFVSSLSSASRLSSRITVPEGMFHDPSAPSAMGYGQSKYAAEHILNRATEASQGTIPTAILRVGQIAGPVQTPGIWPVQEWVPSLVISSRTVGALPSALGYMDQIDWVPIDLLAASIVELMNNQDFWNSSPDEKQLHSSKVLHITNPSSTPWAALLPSIQAQTGVDNILPLSEWIEAIRQGPNEDSTAHRNPAKKILPFYEALNVVDAKDLRHQRFELGKMARFSKTFERLTPVSGEWMTDWANRW